MDQQDVLTIKIGDKFRDIKIPRSWDDLDDRTALMFYNTLFTGLGDEFTHAAFTAVKIISLTQHILGFTPDMMAKWEADSIRVHKENGEDAFLDELKQVVTAAMGGLFDVVMDEETGATGYAVKFNRTKNIWPVLTYTPSASTPAAAKRQKTTWYYAPKDGLANITIYELAYTFAMYEGYVQSREEQYAHRLIAALYRPSRPETRDERESAWHGDRRQPLRRYEDKVPTRMKLVATLPALTRRFLVFWFAGCREVIVKQYPRVFRKDDGASDGRGGQWGKLLLSVAETGTFGALGRRATSTIPMCSNT